MTPIEIQMSFDDLEYEGSMWSLAPAYGFGLIKGSSFSTIPSGYSINIITPYGFEIGPLYYNISFAIGSYKADINLHSEVSAQIIIKIDKIQ